MWKFQDFCTTHILREINFADSRTSKTVIFEISEALNFMFGKIQASNIAKNNQNLTSKPRKCQMLIANIRKF